MTAPSPRPQKYSLWKHAVPQGKLGNKPYKETHQTGVVAHTCNLGRGNLRQEGCYKPTVILRRTMRPSLTAKLNNLVSIREIETFKTRTLSPEYDYKPRLPWTSLIMPPRLP